MISLAKSVVVVVMAAAAGAGAVTRQEPPLTRAELHSLACAAADLFDSRGVFADGRRPLLVVNGNAAGRLVPPTGRCPSPVVLPRKAREVRYVRPQAATKIWGAAARGGAVAIDFARP
jgi:hypothetical protein